MLLEGKVSKHEFVRVWGVARLLRDFDDVGGAPKHVCHRKWPLGRLFLYDKYSRAAARSPVQFVNCKSSTANMTEAFMFTPLHHLAIKVAYANFAITNLKTSSTPLLAFAGSFLTPAQTSPCFGSTATHFATTSAPFSLVPCSSKNLTYQAHVSP